MDATMVNFPCVAREAATITAWSLARKGWTQLR